MIVVPVLVRNIGRAAGRHVRVWLVDAHDERVSSIAGGDDVALVRGDEAGELAVEIPGGSIDESELRVLLRWRVAWADNEGPHERTTDTRPM